MNGSIVSSAVTAGFVAQATPIETGNPYVNLGWSLLSAVLATVLSWLAGRKMSGGN